MPDPCPHGSGGSHYAFFGQRDFLNETTAIFVSISGELLQWVEKKCSHRRDDNSVEAKGHSWKF
jgi:hypothetical protein